MQEYWIIYYDARGLPLKGEAVLVAFGVKDALAVAYGAVLAPRFPRLAC